MAFLLLKIIGLLLLAALFGALLMRWWLQRQQVDITTEYTAMQGDWMQWRRALDQRLAGLQGADLSPLLSRLGDVERAVQGIELPRPAPTDLSPVLARVAEVEQAVRAIKLPQAREVDLGPVLTAVGAIRMPAVPPPVDLAPLQQRVQALDARIAALRMPEAQTVDLMPLTSRLAEVERAVKSIELPKPVATDLAPLAQRLDALDARVAAALRMPEPARPTDLTPVTLRLAELERAVKTIELPKPAVTDLTPVLSAVAAIRVPPQPAPLDLAPLQQRLTAVETALRSIQLPAPRDPDLSPLLARLNALDARLSALRMPEPAPATNLGPVEQRLARMEERLGALRIPSATPPVDLAPLQARVGDVERAVRAISIPPSTSIDLQPLLARLAAIESRLTQPAAAPASRPVMAVAAPAIPATLLRSGSKNLLARPAFGPPDDLKIIKGIAEVLESMLHKVGVFYFWQIADWNRKDVEHVDDQLTAFKGRIQRDGWVSQAARLSRKPESARRPMAA